MESDTEEPDMIYQRLKSTDSREAFLPDVRIMERVAQESLHELNDFLENPSQPAALSMLFNNIERIKLTGLHHQVGVFVKAIDFLQPLMEKKGDADAAQQPKNLPALIQLVEDQIDTLCIYRNKFVRDLQSSLRQRGLSTISAPESTEVLIVTIRSCDDLLVRTSIDNRGLLIVFKCDDSFKCFDGEIGIEFPPLSVLGTEKITLEILPREVVAAYNTVSKKFNPEAPLVITPILNVDRENDTAFLRDVKMSLPVISEICDKMKLNILTCPDKNIWIKNGVVHLVESKFSPKSACLYSDNILRALRVNMHYSLVFRELGVYLLCEQLPRKEFLFDLRRFYDQDEYRLYRMDETKSLRLILNPQLEDDSVRGSIVHAVIQDPVQVLNNRKCRNVTKNSIKFKYPNVDFDADCSNERTVTLNFVDDSNTSFGVQLEFENNCLRDRAIDGVLTFQAHSEEKYKKLSTNQDFPDKQMLVEFLKSLRGEWIKFLGVYLNAQIRFLREFIHKDIKDSLPLRTLNWSPEIRVKLKKETDLRDFPEVFNKENIISDLLENYQTSRDLMKAKDEIIEILQDAEVLCQNHGIQKSLQSSNCETLAVSMMYLKVSQLRDAMKAAFEKEKLFTPEGDVDKFMWSGELPDGEMIEESAMRVEEPENWERVNFPLIQDVASGSGPVQSHGPTQANAAQQSPPEEMIADDVE